MVEGRRVAVGDPIIDYFPPIVDRDLFFRVRAGQGRRRTNGAGRKGLTISNLFSGLANCEYCGGPMRFENKGLPPKGGKYLVCDQGKRGLGCIAKAWRYDDFESSILAFVKGINFDQLVIGETEISNRQRLENQKSSLEGEVQELTIALQKTYDPFISSNETSEFVGKKLAELEVRKTALVASAATLEATISLAREQTSSFYEGRDRIKALLALVRGNDKSEAYKLRAQIVDRLKSLIRTIYVATVGCGPTLEKLLQTELEEPSADDGLVAELRASIDSPIGRQRFFTVIFNNGVSLRITPTPNDPLSYISKAYGTPNDMIAEDSNGQFTKIQPQPKLDNLITKALG